MDPRKADLNSLTPLVGNGEPGSQNQNHQEPHQVSTAVVKLSTLLGSVVMMAVGLWLSGQEWSENARWFSWGILIVGFLIFLAGQQIDPEKSLPSKILKPLNWFMKTFQMDGW